MSRVLVTGAAGFIESHLCDALIAAGRDLGYRPTVSLQDDLALQIRAARDKPVGLVEAVA